MGGSLGGSGKGMKADISSPPTLYLSYRPVSLFIVWPLLAILAPPPEIVNDRILAVKLTKGIFLRHHEFYIPEMKT